MYLAHLSLTNFRNYARLELPLSSGTTLVLGDNAQGKSNLLEAILFLATTKSFRAGSDRELINWAAAADATSYTRVAARLQRGASQSRLEIFLKEEPRTGGEGAPAGQNGTGAPNAGVTSKRIRVNGVPKRAVDLIGQANVVMFSPQDIELVSGAPQWRRRYLDVTISQVDSRYVRSLSHYNKVLLQRNHLLRQIRERHATAEQLAFWDQELVMAGAYILRQRTATIEAINRLVRERHRQLTDSRERLCITYRSTVEEDVPSEGESHEPLGGDAGTLAEDFRKVLGRHQAREIAYGATLFGPHRDDLAFIVDERNMGVYGSRGQQRTVVLSLKLAEAAFMRERSGEEPVLLLDDILSELDRQRCQRVLEALGEGRQVLITAIDGRELQSEALAGAGVLRVSQGSVSIAGRGHGETLQREAEPGREGSE